MFETSALHLVLNVSMILGSAPLILNYLFIILLEQYLHNFEYDVASLSFVIKISLFSFHNVLLLKCNGLKTYGHYRENKMIWSLLISLHWTRSTLKLIKLGQDVIIWTLMSVQSSVQRPHSLCRLSSGNCGVTCFTIIL